MSQSSAPRGSKNLPAGRRLIAGYAWNAGAPADRRRRGRRARRVARLDPAAELLALTPISAYIADVKHASRGLISRRSSSRNLIREACFSAFAFFLTASASGQECPRTNRQGPTVASQVQTLEGSLVFHDGMRKWFELRLDQPRCGQTSIELVVTRREQLEVLRGCRVRSEGAINFSPTGYYSLATYQGVARIEPVGPCTRQSPFPDYSKAKPDKAIREYRVDMHIKGGPGDHPIVFRVTSAGRHLQPWQAYASYLLTGGFVLYAHCGEGFVVNHVFGTPEARPSHLSQPRDSDDMAMFDPESATSFGKDLHLAYTCVRTR